MNLQFDFNTNTAGLSNDITTDIQIVKTFGFIYWCAHNKPNARRREQIKNLI